jgi:hypothetical protein
MADKPNQVASPSAALPADPAPLPLPATFYADLAAPVIAALDQFLAAMPPLDRLSVSEQFIKRKRRVPVPFVTDAVSAVLGGKAVRCSVQG